MTHELIATDCGTGVIFLVCPVCTYNVHQNQLFNHGHKSWGDKGGGGVCTPLEKICYISPFK